MHRALSATALSLSTTLGLSTTLSLFAVAAPKSPGAKGIESAGYKWNTQEGEKLVALQKKGDLGRGAESFVVCTVCHLRKAEGTSDGAFPRLAGQHATFLVKQLADIRVGLRDNPVMYSYAATLTNPQELADVSTYIASLPISHDNGRGPGSSLSRGKELYQRDCVSCHGQNGEGDRAKFFPQLAGQHYKYLLRQVTETRNGQRRNADPEMVRLFRSYSTQELESVCDFLSRLGSP